MPGKVSTRTGAVSSATGGKTSGATKGHAGSAAGTEGTQTVHGLTFEDDNEDIQDILEAFEAIMGIQEIDKEEWVLHLTPLLKGKVRAVCTDLGNTMEYDGVKEVILSHHNVSPEPWRKQFRAHIWTKDAEPNEWTAKATKLMK